MDGEREKALGLLSGEGLRASLHRQIDLHFDEFEYRTKQTEWFLQRLCKYSPKNKLWFHLWRSGASRSFTEILSLSQKYNIAKSPTSISKYIDTLIEDELIIKKNRKYIAVAPAWFEELQ